MHERRVIARTGSGHGRTVGGECSTSVGGTHVALDQAARVRDSQTHVVKLPDDAFYERAVCKVRSARETPRGRHAQTGSMRGTGVGTSEFLVNYTFAVK